MILTLLILAADPVEIYTADQHDCSSEIVQDYELRLTAEDIDSAQMGFNEQSAQPVINIEFSERGNKLFVKAQKDRIGQKLPLCFNGILLAEPILREPILLGSVQISRGYTVDEATKLAAELNGKKPTN